MTKAEKFVKHMIRRCREDSRLAWIICPMSESYGLMTDAYAEMIGRDTDSFCEEYNRTLHPRRCIAGED